MAAFDRWHWVIRSPEQDVLLIPPGNIFGGISLGTEPEARDRADELVDRFNNLGFKKLPANLMEELRCSVPRG